MLDLALHPLLIRLHSIVDPAKQELEQISDTDALESWRVAYLGRNGKITLLLRTLSSLNPDERRIVGEETNRAKIALEHRLEERRRTLKASEMALHLAEDRVDVTLPGRRVSLAPLHPITQVVREVCTAFVSMGFDVVEGPDVEWERYNFDLLNIPRDHPARDMFDTFWIDWNDPTDQERRMLLRTHTSPVQARVMQRQDPPIRVIVPGQVYRYEAVDATHESQFTQIEGLAVDKGITFAHLKGTLYEFVRRIFGQERRVRFNCSYFPFVEPGAEMSIDCFVCKGEGCRVCKQSGWIEIMGAGMVHPTVLEGVGYDPSVYTGFAFGMGPERIAMLKYGIDDIRLFRSNDLRFLRQFRLAEVLGKKNSSSLFLET